MRTTSLVHFVHKAYRINRVPNHHFEFFRDAPLPDEDHLPARQRRQPPYLERFGAGLVEIVSVPDSYPLDVGEIRRKACYRLRTA